ncbi:hypothetical protein GW17_00062208 [Ensete ventricosum]|nr:hypothetical protein GW17_00062208 [Ensete ventricosum]
MTVSSPGPPRPWNRPRSRPRTTKERRLTKSPLRDDLKPSTYGPKPRPDETQSVRKRKTSDLLEKLLGEKRGSRTGIVGVVEPKAMTVVRDVETATECWETSTGRSYIPIFQIRMEKMKEVKRPLL